MRADQRRKRPECEKQGTGSVSDLWDLPDLWRVTTLGMFPFLDGPQFSYLKNASLEPFFFLFPIPRIPPNHTPVLEKNYKVDWRE